MDEITFDLELDALHTVIVHSQKGQKEVRLTIYRKDDSSDTSVRMSVGRAHALFTALQDAAEYAALGAHWNVGDEKPS